jgi:hypothetical protein
LTLFVGLVVGLGVALGAVVGADLGSGCGAVVVLGAGLGASVLADGLGLLVGLGDAVVSVDAPDVSAGLSVDLPVVALSVDDGVGESDWLTQGPALNGFLGISSACARCGVKPIPISTAVGMAARATAFPAGTCSLVSSDFRGAACRGPEVALLRDPSLSAG